MSKTIKVKYADDSVEKLEFIGGDKSDWIDLRAHSIVEMSNAYIDFKGINIANEELAKETGLKYKAGDMFRVSFGNAIELPEGYEAHIVPRSSTFKNWGIILTNSMGIIDESYCGDDDYLQGMFFALRDGVIKKNDRIAQFRIMKKMGDVTLEEVKILGNENRGSYGTSGTN